jgi:hypothetical protein
MNREFLKEAIADAKTVKESAIANAKVALEEAFSPQLKSMLASKLEEMDKYEEDDVKEEVEEAKNEIEEETIEETISEEKEEMDEEMDLDEILNELEKEEVKEDDLPLEEELTEAEEDEVEETEEETEEVETGEEDEDIDLEDMSEEDLKSFIEDVIEDMVKAGELEAGEAVEDDDDDEDEMEVDMDMDVEIESEEEVVAEEKDDYMEEVKKELDEAYATINSLNSELNEINLLNAKLLYSNKIFKSKSLNESQKVKVLGAFDKASSVKEVKLVFETINGNFKTKKTKQISENMIGSASKATLTPKVNKKPIVESNEMVARFQKLAGINKLK